MEEQVDLTSVKGVKSEGVDLEKFHKTNAKVESVEVIQVPSNYTPLIEGTEEYQKQWVLKVASGVLESIGEGEKKIDFRASEIFNLIQDEKGKLTGFPTGEKSNLGKFVRDLRIEIESVEDLKQLIEVLVGKDATIKAYEKEVEIDGNKVSRTYLKYLY